MGSKFSLLHEIGLSRGPKDVHRALQFAQLKSKDEALWAKTEAQEKEAMLRRGIELTRKVVEIMDREFDWFALYGIMSSEEKANLRRYLNVVRPKVDTLKPYVSPGRFAVPDVWIKAPYTQEEIVRLEDPTMLSFGNLTDTRTQEENVAHITFSQSHKMKGKFYPASIVPSYPSNRLIFVYPFIDGEYDFSRVPEDEVFDDPAKDKSVLRFDARTNRLTIRDNQYAAAPFKVQISDLPFELGLFLQGKPSSSTISKNAPPPHLKVARDTGI